MNVQEQLDHAFKQHYESTRYRDPQELRKCFKCRDKWTQGAMHLEIGTDPLKVRNRYWCPVCWKKEQARRRMKLDPRLLPTILIVIDVLAALAYIPEGDWRRMVYWLAAATLTTVVTW